MVTAPTASGRIPLIASAVTAVPYLYDASSIAQGGGCVKGDHWYSSHGTVLNIALKLHHLANRF